MRQSLAFGLVIFLVAVFVAILFVVFASVAEGNPVAQAAMVGTVGVLFIVAALLVSGNSRTQGLDKLHALAAHYGVRRSRDPDKMRRRILLHLWEARKAEERGEGPGEAPYEVLEADVPSPSLNPKDDLGDELPDHLAREARYLLGLARLFDVDIAPYRLRMQRARRAARAGRVEEWMRLVRQANQELRTQLEEEASAR